MVTQEEALEILKKNLSTAKKSDGVREWKPYLIAISGEKRVTYSLREVAIFGVDRYENGKPIGSDIRMGSWATSVRLGKEFSTAKEMAEKLVGKDNLENGLFQLICIEQPTYQQPTGIWHTKKITPQEAN